MKMTRRMSWQEYSNHPQVKPLVESKGIAYVRDLYLLEFKRAEFYDPIFPSATPAQGQGTALTITGNTAEVSRFTWTSGLTNGITGSNHPLSASIDGFYVDVTGYNNTTDYSLGWSQSFKTFRFYLTSGSSQTYTVPSSIAGVVTASYSRTETVNVTGSLINKWKDAITNQSATAVVGGFTNTIAPADLFSATVAAGSGSITFTNDYKSSVPAISTNISSGTGSVATITNGLDQFMFVAESPVFDATTDTGYSGLIRVPS
jgi:hypothetical protein